MYILIYFEINILKAYHSINSAVWESENIIFCVFFFQSQFKEEFRHDAAPALHFYMAASPSPIKLMGWDLEFS